jgi:ACT domain-containing protein
MSDKDLQERTITNRSLVLKQLAKTPIVQIACEKVGIARSTYYRWRKADKEFAKKADQALQDGVMLVNDMAESQLLAAIRDRNLTSIIFWLKHHHRAYANKLEVTTRSADAEKLTEAEQKLVVKAMKHASLLQNSLNKGGDNNDKK